MPTPKKNLRRRKITTEDAESSLSKGWPPNWAVSFADMTTILMSAFLLWYSLTTAHVPSDLLALKKAVSMTRQEVEAFKTKNASEVARQLVAIIKQIAPEQELMLIRDLEKLKEFQKQIRDYIKEEGLEDLVEVQNVIGGIVVIPRSSLLFAEGEEKLKKAASGLLNKLALLLKKQQYFSVRIEGHTDPKLIDPFHLYKFRSNLQLSYARALSVAEYFISQGIPQDSLGVMGYGEEKPKFPNDTEENMAKNRRVEIYISFIKPSE